MAGRSRWLYHLSVTLGFLGVVLFAGAPSALAVAAGSTPAEPTVKAMQEAKLGHILTDNQGMTLYTFKADKPGESECQGNCAQKWPPLTIANGVGPTAAADVSGKLGEIQRPDGSSQVTYNGMPLYRYAGDKKPGETNGQGLLTTWYVVPTTTATAKATGTSTKGW